MYRKVPYLLISQQVQVLEYEQLSNHVLVNGTDLYYDEFSAQLIYCESLGSQYAIYLQDA